MKQNILITGCSSGIGKAAALLLQSRGHRVFATARKDEDVMELAALGFEALSLDVTDSDSIDAALHSVSERTEGKLDVVLNNGAYGQPGAVEDLSVEVLKEQFETNVFGWHYLTRKALQLMRRNGGRGKIIQHSSVLGLISLRFRGAYNASKYALEGLCDTMRLELADTDIHVISVNTGPVTSRFRDNAQAMFEKNIDAQNSFYKAQYDKELRERFDGGGGKAPFTLSSEQAAAVIGDIVEAKNPKPRYYITKATYLLGFLKRILSTKALDRILVKI